MSAQSDARHRPTPMPLFQRRIERCLPIMRPAHLLGLGVVLACTTGFIVQRFAAPRSHASPAALAEASVHPLTSPPPVEPATTPPAARPSSLSAAQEATPRLLLARRCLELADTDPLAAIDMAVANQLHDVDPGLIASLMTRWAAQDFDGAYEWTRTQEPGAWRNDILGRLAFLRAQTAPIAAARLVVTDIPAGHARDEAMISVIHQWALKDTEAAGLWARSLDNDRLRERATAEVAGVVAASFQNLP